MAVIEQQSATVRRFVGLSTDPKPAPGTVGPNDITLGSQDVPDGSRFLESNTGENYTWYTGRWNRDGHPLAATLTGIETALATLVAESQRQTQLLRQILEPDAPAEGN